LEATQTRKWRYGKNRWYVLLLIVLTIVSVRLYYPVRPVIQVAAEHLMHAPLFTLPWIGEVYLTNTMTAMVVMDIILLLIALAVRKAGKSENLIPQGVPGGDPAGDAVRHDRVLSGKMG
jgi:F-type H+-transporting ATPase subunit a